MAENRRERLALALIVVFAVVAAGATFLSIRDHRDTSQVDRRVKQYEQCIENGGTNATCPSP